MKEKLTEKQLNETFAEIFHQSDRASAVVSGGIVEEILEMMLINYLLPNSKIKQKLFDGTKALSTFSAKTELSFQIGLINKTEYEDLKIIKKIRNDFALSIKGITFETRAINDKCKQLKMFYKTNPPEKLLEEGYENAF